MFRLLLRSATFSCYTYNPASDVMCTLHTVFPRDERDRCVVELCKVNQTSVRCAVYGMSHCEFQEIGFAAGCQTCIHFFPVSEVISSPYVIVNAHRDTAPSLRLQICAVEEEGAICLLVMCLKLGSYFTPAGIYFNFPSSGQLQRC